MNPLRRRILNALVATLATLHANVHAQQKTRRVFWFPNEWPKAERQEEIRKAIAASGHPEWRGVDLSFHGPINQTDLRKMVADQPDVIVMIGNNRLAELARLTREIPVVFYNYSHDPVRIGIVESLRKPGKNFTGTVIQWDQIGTRYWQLLKDVRPSMKRGAMVMAKEDLDALGANPILDRELSALRAARRAAAANLGIEIDEIFLPQHASASEVADAARKVGAEALEIGIPLTPEQISLVVNAGIPTAGYSFNAVRKGMRLIGISFDWDEGENQAIAMVARILRGESPAAIPVYQTRDYRVAVSLRMAREMGIEIPPSILIQAFEIVQ